MVFEVLETATVYKGEEVVVINKADLEAFKANGYTEEAPKKAPEKPVTPAK